MLCIIVIFEISNISNIFKWYVFLAFTQVVRNISIAKNNQYKQSFLHYFLK